MIEQVAELADGGWWYVLPAVTSDGPFPARTVVDLPRERWSVWYGAVGGTRYAAVRSPDPLFGVESVGGVTVAQVLAASDEEGGSKPYARNGGG